MKTRVAVPLLDLDAQYRPLREEILSAITRVCDSQRFILGPEVEGLERELAGHVGVAHAIAMSSGTDAILAVLMALGIGPGDEVITPTFSFFATAGCVSRLGATPVLVDIDPVSYNVDPAAIRAAITLRTRAIIPVHLYGQMADMDPIVAVAQAHGIPVIEDACQAIGAAFKGRQAGTIGAAGCFSFFPSKNLGAFGDAGLVTTNDPALAHELRLLRNHGAEPKYFHKRIGGNFRLDALQAAVLRVKLPHLSRWSAMRMANASRYHDLFAAAGLDGTITLPRALPERHHIYNQYVVRVPDRERVRAALTAQGIGTEVYYPVPFHLQECFASLGHRPGDFPEAEAAARDVLALPIYGELTLEQQQAVVDALGDAVAR
ncbi:MAG TPA: DegT/DnrJ/EryC1/StrS family aminotransferase [Vicinamibacterales bacterium]|nr:DegT/DnrJ/EryC1/StrS family aminotransferase [Vicinamibacterales bacterium]